MPDGVASKHSSRRACSVERSTRFSSGSASSKRKAYCLRKRSSTKLPLRPSKRGSRPSLLPRECAAQQSWQAIALVRRQRKRRPGQSPLGHLYDLSQARHRPLRGQLRRPVLVVTLEVALCSDAPCSANSAGCGWLPQAPPCDGAILPPRYQVSKQRALLLLLHTTCQRLAVRADYTDRSGAAVLAKSREHCKLHHTTALGPARSVSGSSAPLPLASGVSLSVSLPASMGCMAPVASHSDFKDRKHMYTNRRKSAASSCTLLQPHSWVQPGSLPVVDNQHPDQRP